MSAPLVPLPYSLVFTSVAASYNFSPSYSNASLPPGVHTLVCTHSGTRAASVHLSTARDSASRFQRADIPPGTGTVSIQGVSVQPGETVWIAIRSSTLATQADVDGRNRVTVTIYTTDISP